MANTKWSPSRTSRGTRVQSAIPTGSDRLLSAGGITLRGVVVAVNVYDSDQTYTNSADTGTPLNSVYCDVLTYGRHFNLIPRCLYVGGRRGLHEGDIDLPRAATIDVTQELSISGSAPGNMDGDHVLVGFIENDLAQPYIIGFLPHPSCDIGNEAEPLGARMRLKESDGNPKFTKHRGSYYGIDPDGNYAVDTRKAHSGKYESDGKEPTPTLNGTNGNFTIDLPQGSTLTVRVANGATLLIDDKDGAATMTLGSGDRSVAVAQELQTLYTNLKAQFDAFNSQFVAHVHPGVTPGPGATAPSGAGATVAPAWDPAIVSDKLFIPQT